MVELACAVALMMLISYSTLDCSCLTSYRIICACCSNSFMYRFCTETYVSTFYKLKIGNINLLSFRIHLADLWLGVVIRCIRHGQVWRLCSVVPACPSRFDFAWSNIGGRHSCFQFKGVCSLRFSEMTVHTLCLLFCRVVVFHLSWVSIGRICGGLVPRLLWSLSLGAVSQRNGWRRTPCFWSTRGRGWNSLWGRWSTFRYCRRSFGRIVLLCGCI